MIAPRPDVALHKMSIQDALRKMFDGHYLNLPVVDEGDIVGIVDVLRLTHHDQIRLIELQPPASNRPLAYRSRWVRAPPGTVFGPHLTMIPVSQL